MLHTRAYISQKRDAKSAVKVDGTREFRRECVSNSRVCVEKFVDDAGEVLAEGCKKASAGVGEI